MRQAAHDLGSLLTVSNGYRQKAQAGLADVIQWLEKSRQADERAMELVKRMLSGNLAAPAGMFDINGVVAELVGAAELTGKLRVDLRCSTHAIYVTGDGLSMYRALLNLCLNAQNAGATRIVLMTRASDDRAFVWIQDNGSGMPADMVARVWDLPVTGDGQHGHGLAIVRSTVAQHEGEVKVASSSPAGTTFEISLPIAMSAVGTAVA
jgi:two-component system OmpR family sensor kinase